MTSSTSGVPTWTVGDTWPPLSGVLMGNGVPVPFTGMDGPLNSAVPEISVSRPDDTVFTRPVTITEAPGKWSMSWQPGDLTVQGFYVLDIIVLWTNGNPETFGPARFYVRAPYA